MPKILMKKTTTGTNDGINAQKYIEGESYDVSDSLAKDFLSLDVCELVKDKYKSTKAESEAPKNKAHVTAPKNKSELGEQ